MHSSDSGLRTASDSHATKAFEPAADGADSEKRRPVAGPLTSAATTPVALDLVPRPVVAGYEILDVVGRGGMGVVYKARHIGLNRIVALKMILGGGHAGAKERARFKAEAEAVARLAHPHIVQIHDIGEADGTPFFSLEFVDGGTLAEILDGTPQPAQAAARVVEQLARAVHAAHQQGIVHRDLKPGNILLSSEGTGHERSAAPTQNVDRATGAAPSSSARFANPKITDFGLAKRLGDSSRHTQAGAILGTPSYMAPEQASGAVEQVGPATDVYALGAILYELLTGRAPFKGQTPVDTVMQVLELEPLPPARLNPRVPRDLETICLKCLQKAPGKRYVSAEALAQDLRRFQAGEPILARPVSFLERTAKWVRRRPAVAGLSAALVLVMIAAFVLVLLALDREHEHRLNAEKSEQDARAAETKANNEKVAADRLRIRAEDGEADAKKQRDRVAKAEKEARDQLFKTLLAQAQAGRWSGRAGRRVDSLDALGKAAAMEPTLQLRNEAIACMTLADMRVAKEWAHPPGSFSLSFDSTYERYARGDKAGNVSVRRAADDAEIVKLTGPGYRNWEIDFDPTGKYLAVAYRDGPAPQIIRVFDVARGVKLFDQPGAKFDFTPDGAALVINVANRLQWFELPSGNKARDVTVGIRPFQLRFNSSGDRLALSGPDGVRILDGATGNLTKRLSAPACLGISWHPDGKRLAAASNDKNVYLWDATSGARTATFEGHKHTVTMTQFSHDGAMLTSESWDGMMRLWDTRTAKPILSVFEDAGVLQRYSHPRFLGVRTVGAKARLWELVPAAECRLLVDRLRSPRAWQPAIHIDGRLLAAPEEAGIGLWDLVAGKRVGLLPGETTLSVSIQPDGSELVAAGLGGVYRLPLDLGVAGHTVKATPPELINLGESTSFAELSPDGKHLAAHLAHTALIWDREANKRKALLTHAGLSYVNFSADGKWIATGTWHGQWVRVWRPDGTLVKSLPILQTAAPTFSPDGKWLLVRTRNYQFYRVGDWELVGQIERNQDVDVPGGAAFTPDGKILALTMSPSAIKLIDADSKAEIATLEAPEVSLYGNLTFSRDGRFLVRTDENLVHQVWDLGAIRRQLAALHLDWDAPAVPASEDSRPLNLALDALDWKAKAALTPEQKWDQALTARIAAVKKNPKNALANNNLAWSYLSGPESRRDPGKAFLYAKTAVELAPGAYIYLNTLGLAHYRSKNYAEAIATLEENVRNHPKNHLLAYDRCFLAMCHHQLGDGVKAKELYDQSIETFRENLAKYNLMQRDELRAFHAEAAALIGMK